MPAISFAPSPFSSYTPVSDTFLTQYMPSANGTYVKVYLYFLHCSLHSDATLTTTAAASTLHMIESDVLEALRSWENCGLLRIGGSRDNLELQFLNGTEPTPPDPVKEEVPQPTFSKVIRVEQKPTYSPDELSLYSRDAQIQRLFSTASEYLGQVLSQPNLSTLYSFYDYYRLPLDVIEYLIGYCVRNGHRDLRYMERVVQDWSDHGISSLAEAQLYIKRLDIYRPILKTLGVSRYPSDTDCATIDRWMNQYQMNLEMLLEACRRTRTRTNSPSFSYTEGILSDWHSKGVHTTTELKALDEAYEQSIPQTAPSRSKTARNKNAFLNYTQRNDVNYDALEQELSDLSYRHLQEN